MLSKAAAEIGVEADLKDDRGHTAEDIVREAEEVNLEAQRQKETEKIEARNRRALEK